MSDPTAAVRIAYDRDHDVGEAALRGMRIELTSLLTDGLQDVWALLVAGIDQSGYRDSWRWRVGCRLLALLERAWPPDLENEWEIMLLLYRAKRFLNRGSRAEHRLRRRYRRAHQLRGKRQTA